MKTIDSDELVKIFPSVQSQEVIQDHLKRFSVERIVQLGCRYQKNRTLIFLGQAKYNKKPF
jgi:hypothetical protein